MPDGVIIEPIPRNVTFEQMNAILTFRTLWLDMAMWMRNFIHSFVHDDPNLEAVTNRLYTGVPIRFYNALVVFYGTEIAEEYLNRISNIIVVFWRLVEAMKSGDQEGVQSATRELYETADQGAAFLASLNDYWDASRWRDLYTQYINLGIQVILAVLEGNYENEIRIYDRIQDLTVTMGNYMANGIIARGLN
ncbi:MAG: hypothetical protein WCX60_03385 [Anaerovoracaceae bacterium]